MGAYTSCIRPSVGSAMVIPSDRSTPERWELPTEAIDVMLEHPTFEVIDAKEFVKTGKMKPMWCGAPLKAKRVYFLVPASQEGSVREEQELMMQVKSLKKLFGRGGTKRNVPLESDAGIARDDRFRI